MQMCEGLFTSTGARVNTLSSCTSIWFPHACGNMHGFRRLLEWWQVVTQLLSRTQLNPAVQRLIRLVGILVLYWHWVACIWWFIGSVEGAQT